MISKEDFNKVWKDSTREEILNQYYYDYIELRKTYSIIKEAKEYIEELAEDTEDYIGAIDRRRKVELLEILDKVKENK